MLLTVFCALRDRGETTFALEVSPELELRDFLALCELESGIPAGEIQISHAEQPLKDLTRALGNFGLKDGDVVVLRQAERRPAPQPSFPGLPRIDFSSISVPGTSSNHRSTTQAQNPRADQTPLATSPELSPQGLDNPALLRDMLLANPHELSLLKERNPPLAEALLSGDLERFTKVLQEQQHDRAKREQERIRLLTSDPFDLEAQAKIEEEIRQHNIEENMTIAMEEAPESFGQVVMLYINCKVNGHPVKAFVDSGAQMTIMSQACAERCNIMRLVDRRWAGIAKGVGTQKIIGRVHLAQVQIEGDFLPCSFSILEDQPMDMLLGLDMLKRHQCSIDLKKSVLLIGTTGTETRFLPEGELPDCARLAYGPEAREDTRPEDIADQELAEALQRSIQDGEIADGKTTSPESPPLEFPQPVHTSPSRSFTLDRSRSAPASISQSLSSEASFSPSQTQGEIKSPPSDTQGTSEHNPTSASSLPLVVEEYAQNPSHVQVDDFQPQSTGSPILPAQEPFSSTVSNDDEGNQFILCRKSMVDLDAGEGLEEIEEPDSQTDSQNDVCLQEVDTADSPDPEAIRVQISDNFPEKDQGNIMNVVNGQTDQLSEFTNHHTLTGPSSSSKDSLVDLESEMNMETSLVSNSEMTSERDQSESNNTPSLAQALKELHKLLMSNNNAQASARSPLPDTSMPDTDEVDHNPTRKDYASAGPNVISSSHTAMTNKTTFAKSEYDALEEDGTFEGLAVRSKIQEGNHSDGFANIEEDMTRIPEGNQVDDSGEDLMLEPEEAPPAEPSQSQQQPLSVAVGSSAGSSNLVPVESSYPSVQSPGLALLPLLDSIQPSTLTLLGQYPVEHIERIQAAGFSSHEAAEALEQAEGSVELALLVLLARKITVPT
ncbi:protein DDI1-like 2 isoform X1 [Silurus meridionalis]|nr:protein DDI1-like 2 isoform X1 [Silurus meridionalis]